MRCHAFERKLLTRIKLLSSLSSQLVSKMTDPLKYLDVIQARPAATAGNGRLTSKVAIVTGVGPGAGIGAQSARLFAREGLAALYLVDLSPDVASFSSVLQSTFTGTRVAAIRGDAASDAVIKAAVSRALSDSGCLDIFYADAGISHLKPKNSSGPLEDLLTSARTARDVPAEEYAEVMRINAQSVFLALKYAAPAMEKTSAAKPLSGGWIIATAPVAGLGASGPLAYSASKAAVISMIRNGADELAGSGVRVNCICPGVIRTDMTAAALSCQMARVSEPSTLPALWLASRKSSYVNGLALVVDGNFSASLPFVPGSKERLDSLLKL